MICTFKLDPLDGHGSIEVAVGSYVEQLRVLRYM